MINLRLLFQTFALLLSFCVALPASAQVGGMNGPGNTPTFSPYINLLREGGGVGQNYFGLVRPQVDFAQQNQMLGQGINAIQANQMQPGRMGGFGYTQLGATGHPVMFGSINGGRHQGGYNGMAGGGGFGGGGGMMGGGMMGGGMQGGFGGGAMGGAAMGGFGGGAGAMGGGVGGGGAGAVRGGGYGGAANGGFNPMGAVQLNGPGGAGPGFSGVSGHMAQFGGIGNQYRGAGQGQ